MSSSGELHDKAKRLKGAKVCGIVHVDEGPPLLLSFVLAGNYHEDAELFQNFGKALHQAAIFDGHETKQ